MALLPPETRLWRRREASVQLNLSDLSFPARWIVVMDLDQDLDLSEASGEGHHNRSRRPPETSADQQVPKVASRVVAKTRHLSKIVDRLPNMISSAAEPTLSMLRRDHEETAWGSG